MWILGVGYVFEGVDRKALSPVDMISSKLPPFLLVHAAREIFYLRRPTERFYRKLTEAGCAAELYVVPCANHYTQLLDIDKPGSPQGPRVLDFIRQH
jgi:acetyl esterase/lipase